MLELIGLQEDLVERTCARILENREGNDLSATAVVFPSKRFGFFLRQELSRAVQGNYFPPDMFPIEAFFQTLYKFNFPGCRILDELEAAHAVYESARSIFPGGIYGSRVIGDFPAFLPWAQKVLAALEEILVEDARLEGIDWGQYEKFARLGEYHKPYQAFIERIPSLLDHFQNRLRKQRLATPGMVFREVALLAEKGELKPPTPRHWIFSGFNAMNACERKLARFFLRERGARFILRTDPKALSDKRSPFFLQAGTITALGLELPAEIPDSHEWNDLDDKVTIHPCDGVESEVFQAFRLLERICSDRNELALRRVAVLLPASPSLVPFVQGAVSRFEQETEPVPFNITLGYPLERTPVMQLVDSLLLVLENRHDDVVEAGDYLQLIRHPYVKASGNGSHLEPLKRGIHILENIIGKQNLTRFSMDELQAKLSTEIAESKNEMDPVLAAEILAQVVELHRRFIPGNIADLSSLLAFLRQALESVGGEGGRRAHLFLNEYAAAALDALGELEEFASFRKEAFRGAATAGITALVRSHFRGRTIRFEGSPLKGVQVMGPLEFRGLSFDEVIILDAIEGVLPGTAKYDPILPADIRAVFGIRDHSDWERIYALNFFSLLGAAGKVHILYPRRDEKGKECDCSRFIERISYEIEKRTGSGPVAESLHLPFAVPERRLNRTMKTAAVRKKLNSLVLSPSSLDTYIKCPLRFYFANILGLREREEIAMETEGDMTGKIAHEALRIFFLKFRNTAAMTAAKSLEDELEENLAAAFRQFNFDPGKGLEKVRAWTLLKKLQRFIRDDRQRMAEGQVRIESLEKAVIGEIAVPGRAIPAGFSGRIDRCESQGGITRIIDYKTGSMKFTPENMIDIPFTGESLAGSDEGEYLKALDTFREKYQGTQLLLYLLLLAQAEGRGWEQIDGAYVLLHERNDFYAPLFARNKEAMDAGLKAAVMEAFRDDLGKVLADLYARDAFLPNPSNERTCGYCPFRLPCGNL